MVGYIIDNGRGSYLSERLFWYNHETPVDAWVHSPAVYILLRDFPEVFADCRPLYATFAVYNEGSRTTELLDDRIMIGETES